MQDKMNMSISEGDAFFAHQASVNFNPQMLFLDFKSITPRIDERSTTTPTIVLKHNLIMIEPYHALLFKNLLDKVLKDYEKEFGKLDKPKALKNIEAKMKKTNANEKEDKIDIPNYFG